MGLLEPSIAIIVAIAFLVLLLYRRVNLGIVLNAAALLLAVLALDWATIPGVIYEATADPLTISVVLATFVIMMLSQLYKETGVVNTLSASISKLLNNPKAVMSILPAVIGLLPVAGGALTSAPLVDLEAEKLKIKQERKAYINLWFRHTIFPVYPLSQPLIVAAALTSVAMPLIILRQIPVVIVMVVMGFIVGFWKIKTPRNAATMTTDRKGNSNMRRFLVSFSPILFAIIVNIALNSAEVPFVTPDELNVLQGFNVLIATLAGLFLLIFISRPSAEVFVKPLHGWGIYGITLAAYGAFLLRETMDKAGISLIFRNFISNGTIDLILLLTVVPAVLGMLTGSPLGGASIGISILTGIVAFSPKIAALIYISAYLGYTVSPTHLCFAFTAKYFECPMGNMYKYVLPSFVVTFIAAVLVYFLL